MMTRPAEGPDAVLRYAAHEDGLVDVHLPPGPTRPSPQVVVVHGDRDDDVPVEVSRDLKARFDWVDHRELAGVDHLDLIDPLSPAWAAVLDAVRG
jgi:hypothetical protein